jgi:hypothetical protein
LTEKYTYGILFLLVKLIIDLLKHNRMKRFYVALTWGGVAFILLALDLAFWFTYHKGLKDVSINIAIGVLCIVAFVMFIRNAKKDINMYP